VNHLKMLTVAATVGAVLAGCASAPKRVEQLEQARAEVQTLAQDPQAATAASRELTAARASLAAADQALTEKKPVAEITHHAYVAERQAEIGQARLAELRSKEQVSQGEAERNRVLLEARTMQAESAMRDARTAQSQAQAQSQEAEAARKALAELQAKQTERGMVLTLGDVLFDTAQATLKPGANLAIDRLAQFMQGNPDTRIIIEGHTDSRGSDEYNLNLSERRAQAVSSELISRGIASSRFEVLGRGKSYPVATNDDAAGRQANRRVEIVFSDESGRFAQGANRSLR